MTDRSPYDPSFWLPFASLWFELGPFPLCFLMAFQPPRGLLPMLQRQNYPQQPSPAASNHHGNMCGNNTAGTLCGPCWGLAMDAPLRPGHHRLQLQLHANPTIPPLLPAAPIFPLLPPAPSPAAPFSPLPPPPRRRSKATPPPALCPLHSVPTPAEFNPDDDRYDTTHDLPKVLTHTAFTRQLGIEGQDIARVSLLNFFHEQWSSRWLRHLAHGGEVRIVVAKSMPESVFAAGLLSQIRQRHLEGRILAAASHFYQ